MAGGWIDQPFVSTLNPEPPGSMVVVSLAAHRPVHGPVRDQPEKREFCRAHGIELVVLKRLPHAGLPARSSTELRGY